MGLFDFMKKNTNNNATAGNARPEVQYPQWEREAKRVGIIK